MDRKLEDSKTFENLKAAFFEEAGLASRYRFFATVAEFEGLERHGSLFRELADGGTPCVHGCLDFLRLARDPSADVPIGDTRKNLEALLQTESGQYLERYPEMARIAREEGFTDVASWFETLAKLKRARVDRIGKADEGGGHGV